MDFNYSSGFLEQIGHIDINVFILIINVDSSLYYIITCVIIYIFTRIFKLNNYKVKPWV